MRINVYPTASEANHAAASCLAEWLLHPQTKNLMLASGNTPLDLYRLIAERSLPLGHLTVFALDDYVGVPLDEPGNCANFIKRYAIEAWRIPLAQFHRVDSPEATALETLQRNEALIAKSGGLDAVVLGLGQNGHLGFNEPGSSEDSPGRIVDLEPSSVQANEKWFQGAYAPAQGATTGLKTILAARHVLIMAYGSHKAKAVRGMIEGPRSDRCPASFLQSHPDAHVFLDASAAAELSSGKAGQR